MLEYFGQSPIIVRSSSLLEDAFGSAFAGKYESFFCVNQASPEKRYELFEEAVKRIFAGIMGEDALSYRRQRGLDQMDEQMAIMVQRVSGSYHKKFFFPELAGVGLSRNPYVWKKDMKPEAGMLRLVMGLGTRAVNRVENDYPRIVAMDDPTARPLAGMQDIQKYSQHHIDYLDLEANSFKTAPLWELAREGLDLDLSKIAVRRSEAERGEGRRGAHRENQWILTFDDFLGHTPFVGIMNRMLRTIEKAYTIPVEIEFTVNHDLRGGILVNLVQCRPFQSIRAAEGAGVPEKVDPDRIFLRTGGNFIGGNVSQPVACLVWVDPQGYAEASLSEKYSVARLVGKLNRTVADRETSPTMLVGPGRWGTKTPAMGVPVSFSEINRMTAVVEISSPTGSMIPDLSFGTHFFHDLAEAGIFYAAVYPENSDVVYHPERLSDLPNALTRTHPMAEDLAHIVKVYDLKESRLTIRSDVVAQELICYWT